MTSSSDQSRTMRSIPMMAMCTLGTEVHIRPLPSFSIRQIEPVSATAKFTPETPTPADRKLSRRRACAYAASAPMSASTGWPPSAAKRSATV